MSRCFIAVCVGQRTSALWKLSSDGPEPSSYATCGRQTPRVSAGAAMDFQHAERSRGLQERVRQFARRHVEPVEELYYGQVKPEVPQGASCLTRIEGIGAREGLWNLFLSGAWRRPYQPRKCASRRKSAGACFGRLKSSRRRILATSRSYGITAHPSKIAGCVP